MALFRSSPRARELGSSNRLSTAGEDGWGAGVGVAGTFEAGAEPVDSNGAGAAGVDGAGAWAGVEGGAALDEALVDGTGFG